MAPKTKKVYIDISKKQTISCRGIHGYQTSSAFENIKDIDADENGKIYEIEIEVNE